MPTDNYRATGLSRTRADALDRAAQAWRLRTAGVSWDQIAVTLGYADKSAAHHAVSRHFSEVPQPSRDLAREVWRERGEMVWRQALADVLDRRPGAVRAAVSLMQRASALDGLDAPTHEVLRTPAYAEIARWAAQMQERMRSEIVIEADILDEKE